MNYLILLIILIPAICLIYSNLSNYECMVTHTLHNDILNSLDNLPDKLYHHLKYFNTLLKSYNIKYWIVDATLLGAVRDNNIVPNDIDIDIAANIEDTEDILALNNIIKYDGYRIEKIHAENARIMNWRNKLGTVWLVTLKIYFLNKPVGDIHLYQKFDDGFMRRFDKESNTYYWPPATYPAWFTDELISVRIRDILVPAPRDPEILLEYFYGKNWKVYSDDQAQGDKIVFGKEFYGRFLTTKLSFLTDYLRGEYRISLKPNITHTVKYVYPPEHVKWYRINDMVARG